MLRRSLLLAASGLLVAGGVVLAGPSGAAPGGAGCLLAGTASFSPGLTTTSSTITYTFTGTLTHCVSNVSGAPTSGTVGTASPATLTGSCASSTSSGIADVTWSDGNTSAITYTTTGALALVNLQGTITSSTEPAAPVGDNVQGALTFSTNTPQACASGGLASASINGFTGLGAA